MTLEKDKEDSNKYYFTYPKPPVLEMGWANCDINWKWANISKFSALDKLMTPLRLLKLFFVTYQLIRFLAVSSYTAEKAGANFEVTNEKIQLFLRMLLLTGCPKLPNHKMYWETTPDTFFVIKV